MDRDEAIKKTKELIQKTRQIAEDRVARIPILTSSLLCEEWEMKDWYRMLVKALRLLPHENVGEYRAIVDSPYENLDPRAGYAQFKSRKAIKLSGKIGQVTLTVTPRLAQFSQGNPDLVWGMCTVHVSHGSHPSEWEDTQWNARKISEVVYDIVVKANELTTKLLRGKGGGGGGGGDEEPDPTPDYDPSELVPAGMSESSTEWRTLEEIVDSLLNLPVKRSSPDGRKTDHTFIRSNS